MISRISGADPLLAMASALIAFKVSSEVERWEDFVLDTRPSGTFNFNVSNSPTSSFQFIDTSTKLGFYFLQSLGIKTDATTFHARKN
eukprot:scaffold20014_cov126-Skeletonema_marinoi.AAC.2